MKRKILGNKLVAVVIPCYRVRNNIIEVLNGIGNEVFKIYVIDDACPQNTGEYVKSVSRDPRIVVLKNPTNLGVGGAVMVGYRQAILEKADVIVKLDGDGQMDPALIPNLLEPIRNGSADYVKGNRFWTYEHVKAMPKLRLIGNLLLSFLAKASSGYWNIFDPNNGFTAIKTETLKKLPMNKIDKRYYFESDMLFRLYLEEARVAQFIMFAKYANEKSNMKIFFVTFEFFAKHLRNLCKRIFYTYFIRDFSIASLNLLVGLILTGFGLLFGFNALFQGLFTEIPSTTGTQIITAISILSGLQFLLSFANVDLNRVTSDSFGHHK